MGNVISCLVEGSNSRLMPADLHLPCSENPPVVIFVHGFKGFKDWGHWPMVGNEFAKAGFAFLRFNFSHNGTTPEQPSDFADLEAFSDNNLIMELDDLATMINGISDGSIFPEAMINREKIFLLGHSRGGGIAVITAAESSKVKGVSVVGSVNHYGRGGFPVDVWEKTGVIHIPNARTGQEMPMKWQFVEVLKANMDRLNILEAAGRLSVPGLVIHGTADPTVPYQEALEIVEKNERLTLVKIENGDHVLGGSHPFNKEELPKDTLTAVDATVKLFASIS